jgi:hypothetical protein
MPRRRPGSRERGRVVHEGKDRNDPNGVDAAFALFFFFVISGFALYLGHLGREYVRGLEARIATLEASEVMCVRR